MIRLTRCTQASKAGTYFRLHLQAGDSAAQPIPAATVRMRASWVGTGLQDLNIDSFDQPTASHLVRLGRGLHPTEKKRLAPSKNRKRAYYDLTITAPKTISVAALLAPDHITAQNVLKAHQNAVGAVCKLIGPMMHGRTKDGPKVEKWLGAVFCHTHTREGDPHLHGHVIVPNIGKNALGDWRAVKVDVSGVRRSRIELTYGHELARSLRNFGLGPEIVMRRSGLPEIRSLLPLAKHFARARNAVLAASKEAEEDVKAQGRQPTVIELHPRSKLPLQPDHVKFNVRRRIADTIRKPKAKDADTPGKLEREAYRWRDALTDTEDKTLMKVLDAADYTHPRYVRVLPPLPPPMSVVIRRAFESIPWGVPTTAPVLFRAAVRESAGQHAMEDLRTAVRERMERRKKNLARIRAQIEADSIAMAQAHEAEVERANAALAGRGKAIGSLEGPAAASEAVATPLEAVAIPQDVGPVEMPEEVVPAVTYTRGWGR